MISSAYERPIAVPVKEPGVIVRLDINTYTPLEITASFTRDFQLMWPAGLGGTFASWDAGLDAFVIGEERRRFYGIPSARPTRR